MCDKKVPAAFIDSFFYRQNDCIRKELSVWEGFTFFKEDIFSLPLPEPENCLLLFYNRWQEASAAQKDEYAKIDYIRLWLSRYIQLYHWIDCRHVQGIQTGIYTLSEHPAAPLNAADRLDFILSNPVHYTRIMEIEKMIQESRPRIRRYLKNHSAG